jgi:hypothetical protein
MTMALKTKHFVLNGRLGIVLHPFIALSAPRRKWQGMF